MPSGPPRGITYYIRPGGNDSATGTSPTAAWRTLARASRASLRPGDRLLLLGGHSYTGQLRIGPGDAGDRSRPVLVGSYGSGRATIESAGSAVVIFDTAGVRIWNLVISGRHALRSGTFGVKVDNDLRHHMLHAITISNVDISGFGAGIGIIGAHEDSGFANVRIANATLHGNMDAGLESTGPPVTSPHASYAHRDIYVWRVRAFGNRGNPANTTTNSGNGIVLSSVRGATVSHCQAYDNGGRGGARDEGPIGIWAYDATDVTLTADVSHDNTSASKTDGGGFGLDNDTSNSTMEYDLSYDNHGPGFLLYSGPKHYQQSGNVVRFNVSYRDGQGRHLLGGLAVVGRIKDAALYQNTIVLAHAGMQTALRMSGPLSNVRVLNNIFVASTDGLLVLVGKSVSRSNAVLAGNDYYAPGTAWTVDWRYAVLFHSLASWRSETHEESLGSEQTGLAARPLFTGPLTGPVASPHFQLGAASPLRGAGVSLTRRFGLRPGSAYLSGLPYRAGTPDIGAG